MNSPQTQFRAPTSLQVVIAIAQREIRQALRRKLVKFLFIANLLPSIVMAVIIVVNIVARKSGMGDLDFDPLTRLLQIQAGPVLLLALGIGTPLVSRDRSEDVLFLYATRPVTPWSYTFGKMLAVALPAVALLVLPGLMMALLRLGLMEEFGVLDSIVLLGKIFVVAVFMAWGYAGVTVGPSAATRKARWALLLAFGLFAASSIASQVIWGREGYALSPPDAVEDLIGVFFENDYFEYGLVAMLALAGWGVFGALITSSRVRREMTP